jgi:hypothetical protein
VEIIVKLHQDIALSLRDPAPPPPVVDELVRVVEGLGGTLSPLHPGGVDPLLVPFYRVEVDEAGVEHALEALLASDAVDAAYTKPADELP